MRPPKKGRAYEDSDACHLMREISALVLGRWPEGSRAMRLHFISPKGKVVEFSAERDEFGILFKEGSERIVLLRTANVGARNSWELESLWFQFDARSKLVLQRKLDEKLAA